MKRQSVESSHIAGVGYEPTSRKMHIEFKNGAVYEYTNVPEQFHKTMLDADSHGEFFHQIFKPHFKARRLK